MERLELRLSPIDDDIVEVDETYSLTIVLVLSHNRILTGENKTTTITIYNDDGKQMCDNNSLINNQVLRKIKIVVKSDVKNWVCISFR